MSNVPNIFRIQKQPPAIGPETLKKMEKEKQVEALMELAAKKGLKHAIKVAEALEDPYVLDRFHDELKKSKSASPIS